jgi:hypothetical protein
MGSRGYGQQEEASSAEERNRAQKRGEGAPAARAQVRGEDQLRPEQGSAKDLTSAGAKAGGRDQPRPGDRSVPSQAHRQRLGHKALPERVCSEQCEYADHPGETLESYLDRASLGVLTCRIAIQDSQVLADQLLDGILLGL